MIAYQRPTADLTPDQLQGFFVNWPHKPDADTLRRVLLQSGEALIAVDEDSGRVVGLITALTDGVLTAFIPLLEILPEYQGRGIGQTLVKRMFDLLDGFYAVDLICDAELQPYYARLGMQPAVGMVLRRYEYQTGRPTAT